jgi:hypothetical protein
MKRRRLMTEWPIDKIRVGERHRVDLGQLSVSHSPREQGAARTSNLPPIPSEMQRLGA